MRFSLNKLQAVYEHCRDSEDADPFISYLFNIVKFHSRWQELDEDDFTLYSQDLPIFRGNYTYPLYEPMEEDFIAYDDETYDETETMNEHGVASFERIIAYCEEQNLELLLIKTPKSSWTLTRHMQVEAYAQEKGLTFFDFDSKAMIQELGLDFSIDFRDKDHLNILGARKLSNWLGAYMKQTYDLTDYREVEGFDDLDYDRYLERLEDCDLQVCQDPLDYFSFLNNGRYEVFVQLTLPPEDFVTTELAHVMQKAGFATDLTQIGRHRYLAHLKNGSCVYEELQGSAMEYYCKVGEDDIRIRTFSSYVSNSDEVSYMYVDYVKEEFSSRGLNILVYDSVNEVVVDKATICAEEETGELILIHDNDRYNER